MWHGLLDQFAWPAWLLILIPAPVGLLAAFIAAFGNYFQEGEGFFRTLFIGSVAGVAVVLPVAVGSGLFIDSVSLVQTAVAGASSGPAIGVAGSILAVQASYLGLGHAFWRETFSGSSVGRSTGGRLFAMLKYKLKGY
ncbi:hypothetical protein E0H73_45540 [Kribbella pittospori]|uniref:Uncharacterized protein n=1 Tax=Kribbella pittospori TaxID=722689 RepID=A0A4R0JEH5_9ACTN|nr:hypothetical protein [Kribbella pittospori]TCC44390.1 hypothetical protein E0H73_45540 [Kribbella pittospori]